MGFFFRKSVRLGPMRLNLSKSGVGASVGVRGARLTASSRGSTYITLGTHGFYYRQAIAKNTGSVPVQPGGLAMQLLESPAHAVPEYGAIPTASIEELVECSNADLVRQLNDHAQKSNPAIVWLSSLVPALVAASTG